MAAVGPALSAVGASKQKGITAPALPRGPASGSLEHWSGTPQPLLLGYMSTSGKQMPVTEQCLLDIPQGPTVEMVERSVS